MLRQERVKQAIKKEVSNIINNDLKDPRMGFVTIIDVEMSPDMRYAKVFFSVLGKEEEHKKTKDALDSAVGFIRKLVADRIQLRFAPEISFREDKSTEYSIRIQQVLNDIKDLPGPRESQDQEGAK
jgi:ribosome-binding factor A